MSLGLLLVSPATALADGTISGTMRGAAPSAAGQISGTVTDAASHGPIQNIEVDVYDSNASVVGSTCTAADGTYTVAGLATGTYRVGFTTSNSTICATNSTYLPQFFNDEQSLASADPVTVTAGSTTSDINAALALGGVISGTVWPSGGPAADVEVDLLDSNGNELYSTCTASDGTYSFTGLATGTYSVLVTGPAGFYGPCGPQPCYFLQAIPSNQVSVTAGETTDVDFAGVACPSTVEGTVTDATTGAPVAGATVTGYDMSGNALGSTTTNSTGAYSLSIPAGYDPINVGFSAGSAYISQFYDDEPSLESANPVKFGFDKSGDLGWAPGINAALVETPGQIAGVVSDAASSAAIQGATVTVYDATGTAVGSAITDSAGAYTVGGLPPGSYQVAFAAPGDVTQFYDDEPSLADANAVEVSPDQMTPGIDAALAASPTPPPASGASPPSSAVAGVTVAKPVLTRLSETHKLFRGGSELAAFARRHAPAGTTFSFVLNTASTVRFSFMRLLDGRRINGSCVRGRRSQHRRLCVRAVLVAGLSYSAGAGPHALRFDGRISSSRKLRPGHYQLVLVAIDSAGASQPRSISFTIIG